MKRIKLSQAFTLIEPGPVTLVTTHDGRKPNVMTVTWTMVLDFTGRIAITTGPWNHSFQALRESGECVMAIPGADMIDTVISIGTCSGADTDKFGKFDLAPKKAKHVTPPLLGNCLANIECRVEEIIEPYNIVVLESLAAYRDETRRDQRMLHAVGDGTFIADGRRLDRRKMMASKLPDGL